MSTLELESGISIYYRMVDGAPGRPYLVFLHEGLGCTEMWKQFPDNLCRETGCPGLIYDREGYGRSSGLRKDRTVHYLHDYALGELPEVLNALIPGQPYILIGHSDGGSISLIFGAEKPALLKGIITEAAHVFVDLLTVTGVREADNAYDKGGFKGLSKYHGKKTHRIFKGWSDTWLSPWFRSWNIEYILPSVECPVLVIQGKDDHYGTLGQVESIVSKVSGRSGRFLVPGCGHSPHLDQPDAVTEKMMHFIKELI